MFLGKMPVPFFINFSPAWFPWSLLLRLGQWNFIFELQQVGHRREVWIYSLFSDGFLRLRHRRECNVARIEALVFSHWRPIWELRVFFGGYREMALGHSVLSKIRGRKLRHQSVRKNLGLSSFIFIFGLYDKFLFRCWQYFNSLSVCRIGLTLLDVFGALNFCLHIWLSTSRLLVIWTVYSRVDDCREITDIRLYLFP